MAGGGFGWLRWLRLSSGAFGWLAGGWLCWQMGWRAVDGGGGGGGGGGWLADWRRLRLSGGAFGWLCWLC